MENTINTFDELFDEERLTEQRMKEQKSDKDYNDEKEKCDNCGSYLNSHDHCTRCDY